MKLEGLYRHASTHAAGIVIGERPLTELVPMYRDPRSDMPVTQYSLKWVEPAGLVKFDFLGLKTLTTLDIAAKMINRNGTKFDLADIPIDDEKTFFDVGSGRCGRRVPGGIGGCGGRWSICSPTGSRISSRSSRFIGRVRWRTFRSTAPARPAASGSNICTRCSSPSSRRHTGSSPTRSRCSRSPGRSPDTPSPRRTSSAAPWARKNKKEGVAARPVPRRRPPSAVSAQVSPSTIFDACAKFAEYGFNKSHSAPYGYITYQTAYLKAHHSQEFLAASMTLDMGNTDKLAEFRADAKKHGIEVLSPDVNRSDATFTSARRQDFLRHRRDQRRRYCRRRAHHRSARRPARSPTLPTLPPASTRGSSIAGRLKRWLMPAHSTGWHPKREQAFAVIDAIIGTAQRLSTDKSDGIMDMFASDVPEPIALPRDVPDVDADRAARARVLRGRVPSLRPSARPLRRFVRPPPCYPPWIEFERDVREGLVQAGRLAGTVAVRNDRPDPQGRADGDDDAVRSPRAATRSSRFSEQILQFGKMLEVGKSVILSVEADDRPDRIGLRLLAAQPLEGRRGKTRQEPHHRGDR